MRALTAKERDEIGNKLFKVHKYETQKPEKKLQVLLDEYFEKENFVKSVGLMNNFTAKQYSYILKILISFKEKYV